MEKLEEEKLANISGGSISLGTIGIIFLVFTSAAALVSGFLDGFTHPKGCNE